ncbi:PDZ domain-containing protein [Sphingobacterium oryzagri]|uniref:PDZ domain-containing protein n=1 Tax=Sphingobacterium oryzagri TaxID=3025669 RepID=A0ABY7WHE6_9SPHI|nr:PDZ domain-containing protein [Sphingobacterium sp. KACC 22765]WDF69016.1 PDZ domain-containing protein [Sphingobacterium sp. KACC 22765]
MNKSRKNNALWFVLLLLACMSQLLHAEAQVRSSKKIYVAQHGRDRDKGTAKKPFATAHKALATVAELKKGGYKGTVEVILQEGTYYLHEPLVIDAEESGTAANPYIIRAAEGEKVRLSGAVPLNQHWEKAPDGIWKTKLSKGLSFQRLYANGRQLIRARYPNFDPTILPFQGYAQDAIDPQRIAKWKNPEGAYVHALHIGRWGGFHYRSSGRLPNGELVLEGGEQNNRPSKMHPTYRFVENVYEELDADDEWYLDEETSTLFYKAPAGVDPNKERIEAPVLESILELVGTEAQPVHDITVKGIHFVHTAPTFMKTTEPLLRSDWTIYRQGAIKITGAERCEVVDNDLYDLGGNAIFVNNYNRQVRLSGNLIERIGAGAINFVGHPDAVRSARFRYEQFVPVHEMDTIAGPKSNNYPRDCEASDNLIRHIGLIEKQVAGVQMAMASSIRVLHNTIYDVPRAGINIGDGTWGGHEIAYNDVFDTVLETSDHGAFNSWGRDRFWYSKRTEMNEIVAAHPKWVLLDAVKTTTIHHNRFQCDHGWDIDLDDGSTNYRIYNNLCLSGGLKLREGFYRVVYNNIIVNNGFHPHVWFKDSHDVFRHNIVMRSHKDIQMRHWGDTVDYNYYTNADDLETDRKKGMETHAEVVQVVFKDPSTGDFTLRDNTLAGFESMDIGKMGVRAARLAKEAAQPKIPVITSKDARLTNETYTSNGAEFKTVQTLGEQSAAGLPSISGVLIVNLENSSLFVKSGLRVGDVIVEGHNQKVDNISDWKVLLKQLENTGDLTVIIYRNQQQEHIRLHR